MVSFKCISMILILKALLKYAICQNDIASMKIRIGKLEEDLIQKINSLQMTVDSYKAYCQLLPDDVCGPCMCKDDDRILKKYYCDCQNLQAKRDCLEYKQHGIKISGIYKIHQNILKIIQVYCDQDNDGGGWSVIQRRIDGSVSFSRDWNNYKLGFGQLQNEFWLGNENIFTLSYQGLYPRGNELRIDMKNAKGMMKYVKYSKFQVGNAGTSYMIHVDDHSGSASNELAYNNGMRFSTFDIDLDLHGLHCGKEFNSGWWFKGCFTANLNGKFFPGGIMDSVESSGIHWGRTNFSNHKDLPLIFSEMKVRRKL